MKPVTYVTYDASLLLFLIHHASDVATRVKIRTLTRDSHASMPVFGLDAPSYRCVRDSFRDWKGSLHAAGKKARGKRCSNSWARVSRALRTDDTPILTWASVCAM